MSEVLEEVRIGRLSSLWPEEVEPLHQIYLGSAEALPDAQRSPMALAAALIETALTMHRLEADGTPEVAPVLLGDLCLAKASRLLVDHADRSLQVAFAQAVQQVAAAAATVPAEAGAVRAALLGAMGGRR